MRHIMETKLYNILFVLWFIKIYRAFFFSEGHKMARFRIMTHKIKQTFILLSSVITM